MSDLISRQSAIEEFSCCELTPDGGIDANYAIDFLKQLPSAQPELVRCKDCMHYLEDSYGEDEWVMCRRTNLYTDGDKYCAWAERKEE